jgi:hypothetical protein
MVSVGLRKKMKDSTVEGSATVAVTDPTKKMSRVGKEDSSEVH